jgi:hypothetical protein
MNSLGLTHEKKKKHVYVCLFGNELISSLGLESTIKQANLKHNNVLVSNLVSMWFHLSIYDTIYLYAYMYKNIL